MWGSGTYGIVYKNLHKMVVQGQKEKQTNTKALQNLI